VTRADTFGASAVGGVAAPRVNPRRAACAYSGDFGRAGAAFAAEIGTMRATEQIDAYMLKTDPIDYLVIPRVMFAA